MCMFICTFANPTTNVCDQKKLLKIFLSYLPLLIMNINFVSMTCVSHCQICFSKGSFSCYYEIFVHMDTHLSNRWICASAMARIPQFTDFILAKTSGQSNEVFVFHILQLIPFYNVFINNLHLFMSSSLMCVFPCCLLQQHHCHVLYYFLSLLFYVFLTVSYCYTHVTSTIYCVLFLHPVHSYKILLFLRYLAYHCCVSCNSQYRNVPVNKRHK